MNTLNLLIETLVDDGIINPLDLTTKSEDDDRFNIGVLNKYYKLIMEELNNQFQTIIKRLGNPEVARRLEQDLINRKEFIDKITVHELSQNLKQSNKEYIQEIYKNGYRHGAEQLGLKKPEFTHNSIRGLKYAQNNSYNKIRNLSNDIREGVREAILETLSLWS